MLDWNMFFLGVTAGVCICHTIVLFKDDYDKKKRRLDAESKRQNSQRDIEEM